MKNNFQSKVTKMPQNTGGGNSQTKRATLALPLRYLCAMLLALFMGVGQMWGTETIFSMTIDQTKTTSITAKETDNDKAITDATYLSGASAVFGTTRTGNTGRTISLNKGLPIGAQADIYIKLNLPSGEKLKEGDLIQWEGTANKEVGIRKASDLSSQLAATVSHKYTIPKNSPLIDQTVLHIFRNTSSGSSTTLTSVTITRPDKITLNANSGTVDGETSIIVSLVESALLPRAVKSNLRFVGWYDDATAGTLKAGAYAKYTPNGNATLYAHYADDCISDGELYTFSIDPKPAADIKAAAVAGSVVELVDYADCDGKGTASIGNNSANQYVSVKSSDGKVYLSGNNSYLKLELACPLEEGDEITFVKSNATLRISYTSNAASGTYTDLASGTNLFTVPSESEWIGKRAIYCFYTGSSVNITSASINRPAPAATYDVTLNPAGGTISPVPTGWTYDDVNDKYIKADVEDGSSVALLALTKDGYKLNGWKDGENADYTSPVTIDGADLTLTAQWAQTYAVTYVPNNGVLPAETMTDNNAPYKAGDEVTLLANTFTAPENKEFDVWAVTPTAGGDPITVTAGKFTMPAAAVTVTATWKDACAAAPTVSATTLGTTSYTTQVVNCAGISVLGSAGCTISEYGFVYGTTTAPTISDNKKALEGDYTVAGTAFPATTLTGLAMNTKYYVRAYATNSYGTAYGDEVNFTTLESLGNVLVVASSASQTSDAITALRDNGFIVTVSAPNNSRDYTGYNLVVLDESLDGKNGVAGKEEGDIKGVNIPLLNLKSFFYNSGRWGWGTGNNGTADNEIAKIPATYKNAQSHPIFAGLTITDGNIDLIDPAKTGNTLQTATGLAAGKEGYVLATVGGNAFIHELTPAQRGVTDAKYLMVAISNNAKDNLSADGELLIVNAAKYLIGSTAWVPQYYTVSFDPHGGDPIAPRTGNPGITLPETEYGTQSFLGWFTEETGGTKIGEAGDSYTPTADITLHAHWEAVSTDARLASITFSSDAGTLSPAFDPEVTSYTYTMPYGTAVVPTITGATSVNANAKDPVIDAQAANWNDVAHIHGVAESDDTKDYYITMKIAPKDPTCLIWADIPSANTLTFNASKSLWNEEDVTLAINGVSGKDGSAPSGVKFQKPGYIKIQKNEGSFQIGDIVALDVTYLSGSTMHVFKVQEPSTAADVIGTGTTATTPAGVNKVTITEDAATLWLARPDNSSAYKDWNPHVDYVAVYRAMNPVLKSITFAGVEATVNEAGKTVTVTVPNATNLGTMAVVPTIFRNAPHATTPEAVTTNGGEWVEGSGNTYRIMDKDGDYTDYTVTITRAAVSHDATLSALTVDGNAIALEDGVYTYAYEYETGTAVSPAPVVAATAHDANAKSVEITQASDKKGTAKVVVTAEDNSTTQTYTINFSISTKIKVVIFDGNDAKATAIKGSPHATGASWVVADLSADDDDKGTSYASKIATGGATSASKNISVTVPVNFKPYFEIAQATNKNGTERTAFITTTANGSGTKLYELANSVTNTPTKGMSAGLTEETTYYIHSNASINFYEVILYLEPLAPKAATPTLSGLANLAACTLGTDELTVTASDLDGGTAHYQWYKVVEGDDPDEAVGTDANTYAPAVAGNYYVVVTNEKDGCRDNSKKSDEVTVSVKTHTEITVAPLNQRATVGNNATLSVTAIGDGILHYTWYTCDDELGTNPVAVDPANDAATYEVTVTAAMNQWYKVTVHSDCGEDQSATAKVSEFVPATPANVTESIVWDWESSAWPASGEVPFTDKTDDGTDLTPAYELLADADAIVPNNAAFRSDMLYGKGQWVWRSGNKFFQGTAIKFTTEVAGLVRVNYRSTGNNKEVQVTIAGTPAGKNKTSNFQWSEYVEVPAGDVEILCLSTDANKSLTRVQKIEFLALAHRRTAAYSVGELGTICLEDDAKAVGANVYELQGHDENGKMVFEQILSGEIEAGKPYLFQATNASQVSFYKKINATHADDTVSLKGMYGTFVDKDLYPTTDVDMFYFSGTHIWAVKDFTVASITIPAYRCYVNYAEFMKHPVGSSTPLPGRKRMLIGVNGAPAVATSVDQVPSDQVQSTKVIIDGHLYILRGEKMYDAKGQLVK